jgi:hypothetical protein
MKLTALTLIALLAVSSWSFPQQKSTSKAKQTPDQAVKHAQDRTNTLANGKKLGIALIMLTTDNNDVIPYAQSTKQMFSFVYPYHKERKAEKSYNPGSEFQFNLCTAGVKLSNIKEPNKVPIWYESKAWKDGMRVVCFADGSAKYVNADAWKQLAPMLKLNLKKETKPIDAKKTSPW